MALTHSFTVGRFHCTAIQDGGMVRPASYLAGLFSVPADTFETELLARGFDPATQPFSINILLIDTGAHKVLVDTGEAKGGLLDGLRAINVLPETIDTVILTHGHRDHIGGIVDADGQFIYPNARYFMWGSEWTHWLNVAQTTEEADDPLRRNLLPIQDRVTLLDAEREIVPGVCAVHAPGHTIGHVALLLESDGERLLHLVDAAHQPIQVSIPDWSPRFDMQPDMARATRRALFERAARDRLMVMAYHFGFPGLGRVVEQAGELRWQTLDG